MKKQGSGVRGQGSERLVELLRQALAPVGEQAGQSEDLWPVMLRRLRAEAASEKAPVGVPWFDWALAGGLVLLLAAFPTWIPVLLYYL